MKFVQQHKISTSNIMQSSGTKEKNKKLFNSGAYGLIEQDLLDN